MVIKLTVIQRVLRYKYFGYKLYQIYINDDDDDNEGSSGDGDDDNDDDDDYDDDVVATRTNMTIKITLKSIDRNYEMLERGLTLQEGTKT